jgi:hypothetical protein
MLSRDKRRRWSRTTEYRAGALAAIAVAAGASATAASVIGSVGALIIGVGLSLVAGLLLRPKQPEPSSGQIETQQQVPPRTFVYGRMQVSGSLGFKKVQPPGNLAKIVLLADGEIDSIEDHKLDDIILTFDDDQFVDNTFVQDGQKHVAIYPHFGSDDQAADVTLMEMFPDLWTADHRLRGISYVAIRCNGSSSDNFLSAYPHNEPTYKAVIRGRRVWDPRDVDQDPDLPATFLWSDNPALCILDWVTIHPKGFQIPRARFDIASFEALADICDELVPLNTGGSERRYRVATQVSLKEPRVDVLKRLREACDAHFYLTGAGLWAIRGGEWTAPTVTLDSSLGHIIEAEMRDGMNALTRYNELAIRYLSPDHNYAEAECDPWQDTADPEFVAGKVITASLDLLQVPSFSQARRLAKLIIAYENPDWLASIRTNFYGLNAIGERNVTFNWSEPGEDFNGAFWLDPQMTILESGTGTEMSLRSADATAYDWDETTEEGAKPPVLPPADVEFTEGVPPDNPGDFDATPGVRSVLLTWTVPSDETFYVARIWRSALGAPFADAIEVSGPRYLPYLEGAGSLQSWMDTVPAGSYRYWLTSENAIGDRSAPEGPVVATATSTGPSFLTDSFGRLLTDSAGDFLIAG